MPILRRSRPGEISSLPQHTEKSIPLYSHAFYLITDQEELIRSLERLIEKNRASPQYQAARARWLSSDDRPQPDRQ